jgi:nitrate/TMAO reductase-like tetraheme cytochrome c subunit
MRALTSLTLGFWLIAGGPAAPAEAETPPSNDDCLACHSDPAAARADGTSVAVAPDHFGESVHGFFSCVDCHDDLAATEEWPHADTLARVSCQTCHDEPVAAFERSVHFLLRDRTSGRAGATCVDCHGMHDIRPSSDPASRTYVLNLPSTCGSCHSHQQIPGPAGEVFEHFQDSVHGRGLSRSGLTVSANCSSCHGAHDIRAPGDPESPVHRARVADTCATCHQGIQHVYAESVHGQKVAGGELGAAVCSDCHTSHEIRRSETEGWRLDAIRECGTCHVAKIGTYRDTYHGKVTALGFTRIATCADCHGSHDILPSSHPQSMISSARRLSTCQSCHPGANENFIKYDPHADKHDRERSPVLYWSARFMQVLLAGVFVFFGAHTLLWFPRSLAARRARGPADPDDRPPPAEG